MPRFVIERVVPGASSMTDEQLREGSLKALAVLRELGPEVQWIHSFVTDDKIYCIYWAPDASLIEEHSRRAGLPIDRISRVRKLLDPTNFEADAPVTSAS